MQKFSCVVCAVFISGCASHSANIALSAEQADNNQCLGSTEINGIAADRFDPIIDDALLAQALGEPEKGGLCQGQVYESNSDVILYRAWNSTNPNSKLGSWWALHQPEGLVADYREDYEICYQWSPLDKLVQCTLEEGSKVVIGNGQSAKCSEYLSYATSAAQQVFIADADAVVMDCKTWDAVFSWQ